jgi:hypothetical protein
MLLIRAGGQGTRKIVDGVDIWTTGEPPRKYQVLGIINDERVQAPFEMQRYYHDVAAKVKQAGGNGAIEAYSNSQVTAIVSGSSTISSGTVSAYSSGDAAFGHYSGRSNTVGWAAPQEHHSAPVRGGEISITIRVLLRLRTAADFGGHVMTLPHHCYDQCLYFPLI